jgi:hypothetical protein
MLKINIDKQSLQQMRDRLGEFAHHLPRHLATAVNRVGKTVRVEAAQQIGKVANIKLHSTNKGHSKPINKSKTLKKAIRQKNKATADSPRITIGLWDGYPFPAKYHEAKELIKKKKGRKLFRGVQFKPETGGGWIVHSEAFFIRSWNGSVVSRMNEGRGPVRGIKGRSPGDYFEKAGVGPICARKAKERLPIEINRRLREITLAASGKIKLRASKDLGG